MTHAQLQQLNPDAFSRFQIVCNEIKSAFGKKRITILDIGGASTFLYNFLQANKIIFDLTIVDIIDFESKPPGTTVVIGSAEKLEFADKSFDLVTGIDMLEHIPNQIIKKNIINEAIRVSGGLVIFAGPCESDAVTLFEQKLNAQNNLHFNTDQQWLAEHFEYGKPTKKILRDCFKKAGVNARYYSALPLNDWYISSVANLVPAVSDSAHVEKLSQLNEQYNQRFLENIPAIEEGSSNQEGYRTFFIGSRDLRLERLPIEKHVQDDPSQIMSYVDLLMESVHVTKDYASRKKDLDWYKKENKKYQKEISRLQQENLSLTRTIEAQKSKPIMREVRRIKKYVKNRKDASK